MGRKRLIISEQEGDSATISPVPQLHGRIRTSITNDSSKPHQCVTTIRNRLQPRAPKLSKLAPNTITITTLAVEELLIFKSLQVAKQALTVIITNTVVRF